MFPAELDEIRTLPRHLVKGFLTGSRNIKSRMSIAFLISTDKLHAGAGVLDYLSQVGKV